MDCLSISPQFFIIILIVFIAEVAGAIVLLVFKPLVSLYTPYLNKLLCVKNSRKYSNLLICIFQAENLIKQLGNEAVKSMKSDYGKNKDVTGLWNTTMTSVCDTLIDKEEQYQLLLLLGYHYYYWK